jgi:hypothetical protein
MMIVLHHEIGVLVNMHLVYCLVAVLVTNQ